MQQLISHLLNIWDNVYMQNAFVYIWSQLVLMLYYTASHCLPPPPTPPSPFPQRNATPRANTAAGYITAGYITDPDTHGDLLANFILTLEFKGAQNGSRGPCGLHRLSREPKHCIPGA